MDPEETLRMAEYSLRKGDKASAYEYLGYYEEWRGRGGFEPEDGDKRASAIWDQISDEYGEDPHGYGEHVEGYENPERAGLLRGVVTLGLTALGVTGIVMGLRHASGRH